MTALAQRTPENTKLYESLALKGDISGLDPASRVRYYGDLCERLGLDPYTQPFIPLRLNGKEILYASRAATDQLARLHNVNREIVKRERVEDVYLVIVRATLPNGRAEDATGAVPVGQAKGEALANALMKAETKAKRRATLAILGLGLLDESELDTIPQRAMQPVAPFVTTEEMAQAGNADATPAPVRVIEPEVLEPEPVAPAAIQGVTRGPSPEHRTTGKPISDAQISLLGIALKELDFKTATESDKQEGRSFIAYLAGLESLESVKDLTSAQASKAISQLGETVNGKFKVNKDAATELVLKWTDAQAEAFAREIGAE